MGRLTKKFDALSNAKKFLVTFVVCFVVCFPAIPISAYSERSIYIDCSDLQFLLFGTGICAAYAAFLAGCVLLSSLVIAKIRRRSPNHCKTCGYDLTGNVSGVCPERGERI